MANTLRNKLDHLDTDIGQEKNKLEVLTQYNDMKKNELNERKHQKRLGHNPPASLPSEQTEPEDLLRNRGRHREAQRAKREGHAVYH